jgi:outer membrane immunogenic protein
MGVNSDGAFGGIGGGYNYQYGQTVFGLEADVSYSAIRGAATNVSSPPQPAEPVITTNERKELQWLGTVRARLGFLPVPSTLVYATGGVAYGKTVATTTTTAAAPAFGEFDLCTPPLSDGFCSKGSTSGFRAGWTLGTGIETRIADHWSVKAEYLYYDLGHASYTSFAEVLGPAMQNKVHFNGNLVRVG